MDGRQLRDWRSVPPTVRPQKAVGNTKGFDDIRMTAHPRVNKHRGHDRERVFVTSTMNVDWV